jgi:anti-sigma factor RsiW
MSAERNVTDQDYERLSAYLDGALNDSERLALETRLSAEASLRRELEALRQTVNLVHQLPPLKAPRNFTLTPAMVRPNRLLIFSTSAVFSAVSALAAMLLLIFGAYLVLQQNGLAAPRLSENGVAAMPTQGQAQIAQKTAPTVTALDKAGTDKLDTANAPVDSPPASVETDSSLAKPLDTNASGGAAIASSGRAATPETQIFDVQPPAISGTIEPYAAPSTVLPDAMIQAPSIAAQPTQTRDNQAGSIAANQVATTNQSESAVGSASSAAAAEVPAPPQFAATANVPVDIPTRTATPLPTSLPSSAPLPTAVLSKDETRSSTPVPSGLIIVTIGLILLVIAVGTTVMRRNRR